MRSVLKIFFYAPHTKPFLVLVCLVLAGFAEALGIMTLLPVITQMTGGIQDNSSTMNGFVQAALSRLEIEPNFANLLVIVVSMMVLKALLSLVALTYVGFQVAKVATSLRTTLIENLMNARWAYFTSQHTGRIANAISNDATRAGTAYMVSARFVAFGIQGISYVAVAAFLSLKLAAIGLVIGLGIAACLNILITLSRNSGLRQTRRTSDLVTYLSDTLNNIKPLKAMARYDSFSSLFETKINGLKRALRSQTIAQYGRIYAEEIIMFISLGAALYAAKEVWNIPVAEIGIMGIISFQMVSIIGKMQRFLQKAIVLESAYWAVQKLIEETGAEAEIRPGAKTPTLTKEITFCDVTFAYEDLPILSQLNLTIPAGKITVLKGPSGSGKTTIIDLVIGFYRAQSGEIRIDGFPLDTLSIRQWRKMIGYVPQELKLFHDTIFANVTLGDTEYDDSHAEAALRKAGVWEFVSGLPEQMQTIVGEHGAKISGGQRQRIALARALITNPRLLILDEVTSALDPESELEICNNIKSLGGEYTVLSITHRPIWSNIADTLYEVGDGQVKLLQQSEIKKIPA
jgi:ATP-binding cassette, subfamily C, bacterial